MNSISLRKYLIYGIFLTFGIIYLARLFYVQVIDDTYKLSANNNVLRYITDYPARGLIYDREGRLIVYNQAVYDLMVIPRQVKGMDTLEFCKILRITKDDFIRKYKKARKFSRYKASSFAKQLSAETYAALQEKLYKFPGFFVEVRTLRKYPNKIAAHLLGYIGEVDEKVIARNPYYRIGDYIGISGMELSYEKELRGQRGVRIVMVDVFNRIKGSFMNSEYDTLAVPGKNIVSSLDMALQQYGEELIKGKKGSIVAIEPSSGEILAFVSSPSYDPNLLVGRERARNYHSLLLDPEKPLFDRALMAYYPPGSTFKLINALIGMQEDVITQGTHFPCNFSIGKRRVHCHPHPSPANLHQSIQYSCNPYYFYVFRNIIENRKFSSTEIAYEAWRKYVLSFGVGRKLNIDMPHELKGFVPTAAYYDKYFGKGRWKSSTIISLGIGQGELGVTPLQMANIMAIIANKGYFYIPHIVKAIEGASIQKRYITKQYTLVDSSYYSPVIDAMQDVVENGTARASKLNNITICGKTGTAQNPHGKDHSLFFAFAPKEHPKIAIAVIIENAGFGSTWAAPIASLMIEKYLTDSISRPDLEQRIRSPILIKTMIQNIDSLSNSKKVAD